MWSGKHAPARLPQILERQTAEIEQLRRQDFVLFPELSYLPASGALLVAGQIRCVAGLYLQVKQTIQQVTRGGANALFCVEEYSYSGCLSGVGTIFRYDSPHMDHNTEHHLHEFRAVGNEASKTLRFLYKEEEIPTLGDAPRRLYAWHPDHYPADLPIEPV